MTSLIVHLCGAPASNEARVPSQQQHSLELERLGGRECRDATGHVCFQGRAAPIERDVLVRELLTPGPRLLLLVGDSDRHHRRLVERTSHLVEEDRLYRWETEDLEDLSVPPRAACALSQGGMVEQRRNIGRPAGAAC